MDLMMQSLTALASVVGIVTIVFLLTTKEEDR